MQCDGCSVQPCNSSCQAAATLPSKPVPIQARSASKGVRSATRCSFADSLARASGLHGVGAAMRPLWLLHRRSSIMRS